MDLMLLAAPKRKKHTRLPTYALRRMTRVSIRRERHGPGLSQIMRKVGAVIGNCICRKGPAFHEPRCPYPPTKSVWPHAGIHLCFGRSLHPKFLVDHSTQRKLLR
jgi:hypothetical protein